MCLQKIDGNFQEELWERLETGLVVGQTAQLCIETQSGGMMMLITVQEKIVWFGKSENSEIQFRKKHLERTKVKKLFVRRNVKQI